MTYGDIIKEFEQKFPNIDYEDIRPCNEMYGVPTINYAIVVWLKDKSKIIYISENARKFDEALKEDDETIEIKVFNDIDNCYGYSQRTVLEAINTNAYALKRAIEKVDELELQFLNKFEEQHDRRTK